MFGGGYCELYSSLLYVEFLDFPKSLDYFKYSIFHRFVLRNAGMPEPRTSLEAWRRSWSHDAHTTIFSGGETRCICGHDKSCFQHTPRHGARNSYSTIPQSASKLLAVFGRFDNIPVRRSRCWKSVATSFDGEWRWPAGLFSCTFEARCSRFGVTLDGITFA